MLVVAAKRRSQAAACLTALIGVLLVHAVPCAAAPLPGGRTSAVERIREEQRSRERDISNYRALRTTQMDRVAVLDRILGKLPPDDADSISDVRLRKVKLLLSIEEIDNRIIQAEAYLRLLGADLASSLDLGAAESTPPAPVAETAARERATVVYGTSRELLRSMLRENPHWQRNDEVLVALLRDLLVELDIFDSDIAAIEAEMKSGEPNTAAPTSTTEVVAKVDFKGMLKAKSDHVVPIVEEAKRIAQRLTEEYPKSPFTGDAYDSLGELEYRGEVGEVGCGRAAMNYGEAANKMGVSGDRALLKRAWVEFNCRKFEAALATLETLISRTDSYWRDEAMSNYCTFAAEIEQGWEKCEEMLTGAHSAGAGTKPVRLEFREEQIRRELGRMLDALVRRQAFDQANSLVDHLLGRFPSDPERVNWALQLPNALLQVDDLRGALRELNKQAPLLHEECRRAGGSAPGPEAREHPCALYGDLIAAVAIRLDTVSAPSGGASASSAAAQVLAPERETRGGSTPPGARRRGASPSASTDRADGATLPHRREETLQELNELYHTYLRLDPSGPQWQPVLRNLIDLQWLELKDCQGALGSAELLRREGGWERDPELALELDTLMLECSTQLLGPAPDWPQSDRSVASGPQGIAQTELTLTPKQAQVIRAAESFAVKHPAEAGCSLFLSYSAMLQRAAGDYLGAARTIERLLGTCADPGRPTGADLRVWSQRQTKCELLAGESAAAIERLRKRLAGLPAAGEERSTVLESLCAATETRADELRRAGKRTEAGLLLWTSATELTECPHAPAWLATASDQFAGAKDSDRAIQTSEELGRTFPRSPEALKAMRWLVEARSGMGDFREEGEARLTLGDLLEATDPAAARASYLAAAQAALRGGGHALALDAYRRVLTPGAEPGQVADALVGMIEAAAAAQDPATVERVASEAAQRHLGWSGSMRVDTAAIDTGILRGPSRKMALQRLREHLSPPARKDRQGARSVDLIARGASILLQAAVEQADDVPCTLEGYVSETQAWGNQMVQALHWLKRLESANPRSVLLLSGQRRIAEAFFARAGRLERIPIPPIFKTEEERERFREALQPQIEEALQQATDRFRVVGEHARAGRISEDVLFALKRLGELDPDPPPELLHDRPVVDSVDTLDRTLFPGLGGDERRIREERVVLVAKLAREQVATTGPDRAREATLALLLATGEKPEQALPFVRSVLFSAADETATVARARLERRQGHASAALFLLERAVQDSSTGARRTPLLLNELAVTYWQLGRLEEARGALEQTIALDAEYVPALANRAVIHLLLRQPEPALTLLEQVLRLAPANCEARLGIADARLELRQEDQAVAAYEEHTRCSERPAPSLRSLGFIQRTRGATGLAIPLLERYLKTILPFRDSDVEEALERLRRTAPAPPAGP